MKRLLCLLIISSFPGFAYAATPTISSVSGTVSSGQTLTISGSHMMDESNANWDSNFRSYSNMYGFEGTLGADGFYYGPGSPGNFEVYYDTSTKLMGNKSLKMHVSGKSSCSPNCGSAGMLTYPHDSASQQYWRFYARFNATNNIWPDVYTKQYGLQGGQAIWYQDLQAGSQPSGAPSGILFNTNGTNTGYLSLPLKNDRWYLFEGHAVSGTLEWWIDNGAYHYVETPSTTFSAGITLFGIINYATISNVSDFTEWMDNYAYSANTRIYASSVIEISGDDGATWKYQPPTSLSDTTISILQELPTLTAANYQLRVTNNLRQTSAIYNLSGSGTVVINGVCGSANGQSFSSLTSDSSNLCASGIVASFAGTGPWTWGCNGSGGGTSTLSTACSALLNAAVVNGTCGSANGGSFTSLSADSSNLCSSGTVASFSGSGPWTWGCNGSGGGTSTSSTACSASLANLLSSPLLFSESFENNSYSSRGWYDNTNQGTIVSGGQSGNCLQWTWAQGSTTPVNGGSTRMEFTPTDSLYISYYVKFQNGWQGSQKAYHPHLMYVLSDLDDVANKYSGLANNYLTTYLEFISDVGSPYAIRPQIALQDEKNVNTSYGSLPKDLRSVTENRSVNYCNTPLYSNALGDCYADVTYYSANIWKASSTAVSTNTWHHIEVYMKMNSISGGKGQTDGIMQAWLDGTQIINNTNMIYRTGQHPLMKWAQFVLAPYLGDGAPIAESMWIDELTLATESPYGSTIVSPNVSIISVSP